MESLSLYKSQGDVANVLRAQCCNNLRDEQFYSINTTIEQFSIYTIYRLENFSRLIGVKSEKKMYKRARIMLLFPRVSCGVPVP